MDLRSQLKVLRAHWLAIVIFTVAGTLVLGTWALLQPKVYAAEASGYLTVTASGNDAGSGLIADNLAKAKVKSYIDVGSWRSVAERAIEQLGLSATPEEVVDRVSVTNPLDTVNINVRAEADTPTGARDLAQAWLASMATEISELETASTSTDPADVAAGNVRLAEGDSARLPKDPSYPNVKLFFGLGALVGLVLGLLYSLARHILDRRIRSGEALEAEIGLAVVGSIPYEKALSSDNHLLPMNDEVVPRQLFAVSEAMRELRTNIQFVDVDNPPRVLVVTSPVPGDGKSTTSSNLAIALAASGVDVYLIDADLRRPRIATYFGLVEGAGLSDILAQRAAIEDVVQLPGAPGLRIIAAGRIPPNPSELLGSGRMKALLDGLAQNSVVILDAPPLMAVTDAAILSTQADGAIVVVSAGKTSVDVLKRALTTLRKVGGRPLGVVLNKVPKRRGAYYDYSYAGDYAQGDSRDADPRRSVNSDRAGTRRARRTSVAEIR